MAFDLCQIRQASKPYYIEHIRTNIWSIEELCFYLYRNIYLIDATLCNEALCDWIKNELGLKKLYRTMYEHLERQDGIAYFVLPIFREIGYLSPDQLREYQEKLNRLEIQPEDERQKLKGDYLVRSGMYGSAAGEYLQILERQGPGSLGAAFYAGVWNNLGAACARSFLFEEAAECFLKAWKLVHTKEMLRKYVSVLPLYLSEEEYRQKLKELGADTALIARIQEYNARVARLVQEKTEADTRESPSEELERLKEEYRKSEATDARSYALRQQTLEG